MMTRSMRDFRMEKWVWERLCWVMKFWASWEGSSFSYTLISDFSFSEIPIGIVVIRTPQSYFSIGFAASKIF